jgi:Zn-finger nucleic acid-binding protein
VRLVVACQDCRRKYDASGHALGSRFRCTCGVIVTIQQPKGHDSAVVRCSSCGGPREGEAVSCGHCGADFTLHERDLQTICAGCMTRVSSKARFCHSCGQPMAIDGDAGDETDKPCPVCGPSHLLSSRSLGQGLSVLECGRCAGLFLGNDTFRHVLDRAEQLSHTIHGPAGAGPQSQATSASQGPAYRACVHCEKLMNRKNYGKRSNVIIDVCKEHGVWFDAQELSRVLAWVREGGLEQMRATEKEALRERERRLAQQQAQPSGLLHSGTSDDLGSAALSDLLRLFW